MRETASALHVRRVQWSKKLVDAADAEAMTTRKAFLAGWITAYVESACVTPFETVKVRMQTKENMAGASGGVRSRNRARGGRARFIRGILADVSAK